MAEYGQIERLELIKLEELVPNDDQVLIDVAGSGVNPIDWKILSGAMKQFIPMSSPYTPGVEVAGTIAAVGKNIHEYAVGDEVFGFIGIVGGYATQALATPTGLRTNPMGYPFFTPVEFPPQRSLLSRRCTNTSNQARPDCCDSRCSRRGG